MNSIEKTIEHLNARGIGYKIIEEPVTDADGRFVVGGDKQPLTKKIIVITNVPFLESEVNKFYSKYTECWFEGCEELRKRYNEALKKAGETRECTSCQKGAIMRQFEPEVRALIQQHMQKEDAAKKQQPKEKQDERHPDPRPEQVSGSNGESKEGASKQKTMLRRAADRFAALFGYRHE